ncbi:MAG TPA: hypothetical protein VMK53_08975 [Gemmatimonadales bacterium]|nr:hypothetical protein [Gemmatimonadales bacterium]
MQVDRVLVAGMHRLPSYAPREGFSDRVMARVTLAVPTPVVVPLPWPRRLLQNRRAMAGVAGTALAMGASVTWTMANRELLDGWVQLVANQGGQWLWTSLQVGVATMTEQPWYTPIRDLLVSPVRTAAVAATGLLVWTGGLAALRRLVALPSGATPGARW